jgi:hypothetical protein
MRTKKGKKNPIKMRRAADTSVLALIKANHDELLSQTAIIRENNEANKRQISLSITRCDQLQGEIDKLTKRLESMHQKR